MSPAAKYRTYQDYVTSRKVKGYSVIPESLYDAIRNDVLDNVEVYWKKIHETIGQCESAEEWEATMKPFEYLLQDSEDEDHIAEVGYTGLWNDYWADYV